MGKKQAVILRRQFTVAGEQIWVEVTGTSTHVHGIIIDTAGGKLARRGRYSTMSGLGKEVSTQLTNYFTTGSSIKLPLWEHDLRPTQHAAMQFLAGIPAGQTRSYAEQATAVRRQTKTKFGPRNAGTANRGNLFPLAIPCHRVVRSDGGMGGFMGSSRSRACRLKQALLAHEARFANNNHLAKAA